MLLEDYDKVVLPTTVMMELSRQKNRGVGRSNRRLAWQILADIDYYVTEYPERFKKVDSEIYREEVEQILLQWSGHEKARTDFTRGHWKRGVE